jgi:hypothetical protein
VLDVGESSAGIGREGEPAVADIVSVQLFPVGTIIPVAKIVSSDNISADAMKRNAERNA